MESTLVFPKDIDVAKLKFSDVKPLSNGSRTVYINYEGGKLAVQTPLVHLPYGLGDWNDKDAASGASAGKKSGFEKDSADKRYDLSFSFSGADENPKMKVFLEKMQAIEKRVIEKTFENRQEWLKDDYDGIKSVVAKLFTPFVRLDKDKATGKVVGKYPPTMKAKLPYDNKTDEFKFDCFDMDKCEIDFKDIKDNLKGAKACLVIELTGMWFVAGKYGCTWKVAMGKFQLPNKRKMTFMEDSDHEDAAAADIGGNSDEEDLAADAADAVGNVQIAESDEEEAEAEDEEQPDEEEEDEPTPPPPPPKKKATAAKTAKK
jgi:hypothetical protein